MDGELSCVEVADLLGVYALDAVDPDEEATVRQHLLGCRRCTSEVALYRDTTWRLANSGGEAPVELWNRIAGEIGRPQATPGDAAPAPGDAAPAPVQPQTPGLKTTARSGTSRRRPRPRPLTAVAVALSGAAAAALAFLGVRVASLDNQVNHLQTAANGQSTAALAALAAENPQTQHFDLSSVRGGRLLGQVLLLPSGTAYLTEAHLNALGAGETYQLWLLPGSGAHPVSVSLLGADPATVAFTLTPAALTGSELLVTVEPAPGVVAPTTAPLARALL